MKIIILAGGKGERMGKLTEDLPKPLLLYKGETLLEHKLKNLPDCATELVIVIKYLGHKIKEKLGNTFKNMPITYVEQYETKGTAHALWQCQSVLNEPFMVLMSDDLYSKKDLDNLSQNKPGNWSVLAYQDVPGIKAGKIIKNENGLFKQIYEDFDGTSPYNLIYTGACVLDSDVFKKEMVKLPNGEYGLPQTFSQFADEKNINVLETKDWIRITKPEDLI